MAATASIAATTSDNSSSVPSSLPPPCPKSPPKYPDLYGKRRGMAKVQMLEREIGFLEEELKSTQGLQPSSRCCKEVTDFVAANPDPLIPTNRKNRRSCRFWKWLRGIPCFNFSWVCCCCYSGCNLGEDLTDCCVCDPCDCFSSVCCSAPSCRSCFPCASCYSCCCCGCDCCGARKSNCCKAPSCGDCCCSPCQCPSCGDCCCCRVTFKCPKCPRIHCSKCCSNCCLFF